METSLVSSTAMKYTHFRRVKSRATSAYEVVSDRCTLTNEYAEGEHTLTMSSARPLQGFRCSWE